jgi:hypothetical protein
MRIALVITAVFVVAAGAAPTSLAAAVYKWVDASGVVNYGNQKPAAQKKVTELDASTSRVSTIPGPTQDELARQRTFLLEARIDRLERELREQTRAAEPVVMLGQPYSQVYADYPAYYGWWGYPVVGLRGASSRRFHPLVGPGHFGPRPTPFAASAPMRFRGVPSAPGRAPRR